ncbi:MAG: beta-N-acetylhexosaminidase [Desulfobacteraceae bacterium]|nr:beta-N-acetylhexosaminidase [Desulfobacteraceae bacterium]
MAGQRLMVGFNGTTLDARMKSIIGDLKIGGIVLFSRNIVDPGQLKTLCCACQEYAQSCGQPPLIVAIDQEGGTVARLKPPFTQFKGMAHTGNRKAADRFAGVTAAELSGVGINMNFAPVMDVAPIDVDSIMRDRAFGHDPQRVAALGTVVINGLQSRNIMAVAKHFPGIGRTTLDSHFNLPDLDTDYEVLTDSDLVPFRASVRANVAGIMLSHIRYLSLDAQWPASISRKIAGDLLRDQLGYAGVVMTDDLDMAAIKENFPLNSVMDNIMDAGIDMPLICHDSPDLESAFNHLLRRMNHSKASRRAAEVSVNRILTLKKRFLKR